MRERIEDKSIGRMEAQGTGSGRWPASQAGEEPPSEGDRGASNGYVAGPAATETEQKGRSVGKVRG